MKKYCVETMDGTNANKYYAGSNECYGVTVTVEAETIDEAKAKAKEITNRAYVVYAEAIEAIEAREKAVAEALKKEEERNAKAKATRKANEEAKAKELGLTVEEYKARRRAELLKANLEREIEEMKKELARKEALLAETITKLN